MSLRARRHSGRQQTSVMWESTCLARHSCDRCAFLVDACVGRLCYAIFALLLFGSVVYAEYTSRQSPVHSLALLSLRSMPFAIDFPQQITCFVCSSSHHSSFVVAFLVASAGCISFLNSFPQTFFSQGEHLSLGADSDTTSCKQ
jgi:hypothetical protein